MRKSVDLSNWDSAQKLVRDWESGHATEVTSVAKACAAFIRDCKARKLSEASVGKYKLLTEELKKHFEGRSVAALTVDDKRMYRETWRFAFSRRVECEARMLPREVLLCEQHGCETHVVVEIAEDALREVEKVEPTIEPRRVGRQLVLVQKLAERANFLRYLRERAGVRPPNCRDQSGDRHRSAPD